MVLIFVLFTFLITSGGVPHTANLPYSTRAEVDDSYNLGRDLPECLKLNHYRTTSQIVWSCVATIFACTWVAIHPNLPGPRDSGFQRFWRRVAIAILAIMAPELIAVFATRQRDAAKTIKREFNAKFNNGDDRELSLLEAAISWFTCPLRAIKEWFVGPPDEVSRKWTLTHGFFVQMGGFMMYHKGKPVQVLTFDRLLKAIERGEIDVPHIPEEDILDKCKGDGLSKLVVVLQTTWFVAQCFGRWISHLPISELEVSTLAFAVLNAYVYAIWWSKPQGVLVPIKLEFKARPLPSNDDRKPDGPSTSPQPSSSLPDPCSSESLRSKESLLNPTTGLSDAELTSLLARGEDDQWEQNVKPVIEVEFDKSSLHWIRRKIAELPPSDSQSSLKRIWEFFLDLLNILAVILVYPFRVAAKTVGDMASQTNSNDSKTEFLVGKSRVSMFYVDTDHFSDDLVIFLFSFFIIPPIFGGIHITLWSASFQTPLEQLLWRISAVYVTAAPLLIVATQLLGAFLDESNVQIVRDTGFVPFFFVLLLYPIARGTLIFISLYTLPHLPEGTYYDVRWSSLLPHI